MNAIETMERQIRESVPEAWTRLRRPRNPHGEWWLDTRRDDHLVTIQWSSRHGFGVSASVSDDGYGEGPDETFVDRHEATGRVLDLLKTKGHTTPPRSVLLHELRGLVGFTQEDLAEKLGVQQAAVSRLERREDMTLSSLKRYVTAMGADLEISIRMENGEHVRLAGPVGLKRERAACVHVEQRLSGRDVLPSDTSVEGWTAECGSWLDEMKATAKNRWPRTPDLVLACGRDEDDWEAASLASSSWSRSEIRISIAGVWGLGKAVLDLGGDCVQGGSLPSVARAVSRTLIGHEIGHFVMEELSDEFLRRFAHRELRADAVSGWLAGRAADDASLGSMIVSRLGCGSETCSHPTPDARSNAYLLGHLEGSRGRQKSPGMNLVVIRVSDLERSREFYSTLGLDLTPEKHGRGPLHYSCEMNDLVIELYPTKTRPTGGGRIGLRIATPKLAVERLLSSGHLSERSVSLGREPRAEVLLVRDPDGNDIELSAM